MTDPVVLVPLDGSKPALGALPIARRLAELAKARVRTLEVRAGNPAEAILAAAADHGAKLIVMCACAEDDRPAGAIGPAALAVLSRAQCPVVLVGPTGAPAGWALRRLLALHDGSPSVSGALRPAAELAHEAGAELVVLQVAGDERAVETGSMPPPMYLDQVQHGWPMWSEEFLHRLACLCPLADVQVRMRVAHGEPAAETIRVAREESADLIVLAWKGPWEARHAARLNAVLQGAPCPILVTRAS